MPFAACPPVMPALGSSCLPQYYATTCTYRTDQCANALNLVCASGSWQTHDLCQLPGAGGSGGSGQGGASGNGAAGESSEAGAGGVPGGAGAAEGGAGGS